MKIRFVHESLNNCLCPMVNAIYMYVCLKYECNW